MSVKELLDGIDDVAMVEIVNTSTNKSKLYVDDDDIESIYDYEYLLNTNVKNYVISHKKYGIKLTIYI